LASSAYRFPVEILEVKAGDIVAGPAKRDGYDICGVPTEHGGGPSLGYIVKEHLRRDALTLEKAKADGNPEGTLWASCQGRTDRAC